MWWITPSCLLLKGRWSHLKITWALVGIWQASETNHIKNSLVNFQHQYLAELLTNVYSYCLMVKVCVAVVCMEGGFSQIWSHIYTYGRVHKNFATCHDWFVKIHVSLSITKCLWNRDVKYVCCKALVNIMVIMILDTYYITLCIQRCTETTEHLLPVLLIADLITYNNDYDNTIYWWYDKLKLQSSITVQ